MKQFRFRSGDAREAARSNPYEPYHVAIKRGELELGYYTPTGVDDQEPHPQDEVYVVVSGRGRFFMGGEEVDFEPEDALVVPAGVEHAFLDFSDDLEVWVIFYGPERT